MKDEYRGCYATSHRQGQKSWPGREMRTWKAGKEYTQWICDACYQARAKALEAIRQREAQRG